MSMATSVTRTHRKRKGISVENKNIAHVLGRCLSTPSVSFFAVLTAVLALSMLTPALVGITAAQDTGTAEGPTVYVGSDDGNVYAVNAETGTEVWSFNTNGGVWSSPTVSEGTVYVGNDNGTVYAIDATDGTEVWSYDTGESSVRTSPTVVDGTVYVGSGDPGGAMTASETSGTIHVIDAIDGTKVWEYEADSPIKPTVSVADGRVYAAESDGVTYAFDAENGTQLWSFETNSSRASSVSLAADGNIYLGGGGLFSESSSLYSLDTEDGSVNWRMETPRAVVSPPTITGEDERDRIYFTTAGDVLTSPGAQPVAGKAHAGTTSGEELWETDIGPIVDTSPTVVGEAVYVGSRDNSTYALDKSDGSVFWSHDVGHLITSSPTVADGTVYFGSRDDSLYALDASNGTERWSYETEGDVQSSPTYVEDPSEGRSVGSRLRLGTRSHHDEVAETGLDSERPVQRVGEVNGGDGNGTDGGEQTDDGQNDGGQTDGGTEDDGTEGMPGFTPVAVLVSLALMVAVRLGRRREKPE